MRALAGPSGSPSGGGTRSTMASRMGSIPFPSFALAMRTASGSIPRRSEISSLLRSGSAPGRSILLTTGMISRSASKARKRFERVWA